jgi:hypothetical protein
MLKKTGFIFPFPRYYEYKKHRYLSAIIVKILIKIVYSIRLSIAELFISVERMNKES